MNDGAQSRKCLLISMPQLQDPNFLQTTSLLSEFNEQGAMGVVLNRPLDITLDKILKPEATRADPKSVRVYWGGPVQSNVGWIIHEDPSLASESVRIEEDLFLSSSTRALERLMEKGETRESPRFRFYLGYAGWGPKQLEQEMATASWVTAPLHRGLIFDDAADTLWRRSLEAIGVDPMKLASTPQSEAH